MSTNRQLTNFFACSLLLTLALVPMGLPGTQSAYGDSETSVANIFQASSDFTPRTTEPEVQVENFALMMAPPPGEVLADIVEEGKEATSTDPAPEPEVQVSEEPVKVTEPEPVDVETSDEPLEVSGPAEVPAEEPVENSTSI